MLYFAWREGPKPSQIESSNLGIVLLQVIGSWLRAKSGGWSHEVAVKADHEGTWGFLDNELVFHLCIYVFIVFHLCIYLWWQDAQGTRGVSYLIGWGVCSILAHQLAS